MSEQEIERIRKLAERLHDPEPVPRSNRLRAEAADALDAILADNQQLRTALQELVDKLDAIEGNESFNGIWTYLRAHNYIYTGPNWATEIDATRKALSGEAHDNR